MNHDVSPEAEQALLGALLTEEHALDEVADLLRPELFSLPEHAEIAAEILSLAAERRPADAILVQQRLAARGADAATDLPIALSRAIGTTCNVRHYAEALEGLWVKREAKRVMLEALRSDPDCSGEEFVSRAAERLSAIETRRGRPARQLGKIMFALLDRKEQIDKHPELIETWPTGYRLLDSLVGGFRPGLLFTIAALRGVGKSAFVASVLRSLALRRVSVGVFQLEDTAEALAGRTFMREGRIPSTMMRDTVQWGSETWGRAGKALERAADWPIYVDDQHARSVSDIAGSMRRMHRQHGVKVFFLDNLAEVMIDRAERREERLDSALGRIAKTFRDTAVAIGAAPVLLVHLNRDLEKRGDGKPRLSDIRNSGEIADASHVVALLHRPQDSDVLTVDVAKHRDGPTGEVELEYVKDLMEVRERGAA